MTKKVYREIAPPIICIFLCSLESFITKSLQDRKKLQTNCSMTIAYN